MKETVLSRSMRRLFAGGAAAGFAMLALPALAQEVPADPPAAPARAAGRNHRLVDQAAGLGNVAADHHLARQRLRQAGPDHRPGRAQHHPDEPDLDGSSQSVGAGTGGRAVADLRGLGGDKTLVLLNGRRLANHPFFADTVDLNIIPVAALDRVEVLRDGASAIYGTDAIGGVINFITKRSVKGFGVTVEAFEPVRSGGGAEQRINLSGGCGDLNTDGFSMFGVLDWHQQTALQALDRDFANTGIRPEHGVSQTSGTPFPANFFSENGITGNPFFASGCLPPVSFPSTSNATCRYDYTRDVDLIPQDHPVQPCWAA